MAKNGTSWSKDNPGPGRPSGSLNPLTKTVKETVLKVFNELEQQTGGLKEFAEKYPRDFYAIAAKLIPTEITGAVKTTIELTIKRDQATGIPHSEFTPEPTNSIEQQEEV